MLAADLATGKLPVHLLTCPSVSTHPSSQPFTHPLRYHPSSIRPPPTDPSSYLLSFHLSPFPSSICPLAPTCHHPSVRPLTSTDAPHMADTEPCPETSDMSPVRRMRHIHPQVRQQSVMGTGREVCTRYRKGMKREASDSLPSPTLQSLLTNLPPQATPTHRPSSLTALLTAFFLSVMSSLQSSEWAGRFR